MKLKTLALAVAVLAVASVAAWFFAGRDDSPAVDPRVGQTLLDDPTVARAAAVHLLSDGKEITLAKTGPAGSAWVVREYHDLPVDFAKFTRLINELKEAKVIRFASSSAARLERMGFDGGHIELRDAEGKAVWSLQLGESSGGARFVKFGDEARAYLAGLSSFLDTTPKNWADSIIVPAKADDVVGVEIGFPGSDPVRFTRIDKNGVWKCEQLPQGTVPKDSAVGSLVSRIAGLRFSETTATDVPEATAARENARTVQLTLADGRSYTIQMGRQPAPPAEAKPAADAASPSETGTSDEPAAPEPPEPGPGPVYAFVQSSVASDPINAAMERRAFQISEWTFKDLPADVSALSESAPPPPAAEPAAPASAGPAASGEPPPNAVPAPATEGSLEPPATSPEATPPAAEPPQTPLPPPEDLPTTPPSGDAPAP